MGVLIPARPEQCTLSRVRRGPHHRLRRHRGLHVRRVFFSGRRRRREGGEVLQHMAPPIIGKSTFGVQEIVSQLFQD